jgi:hypothetical protein
MKRTPVWIERKKNHLNARTYRSKLRREIKCADEKFDTHLERKESAQSSCPQCNYHRGLLMGLRLALKLAGGRVDDWELPD